MKNIETEACRNNVRKHEKTFIVNLLYIYSTTTLKLPEENGTVYSINSYFLSLIVAFGRIWTVDWHSMSLMQAITNNYKKYNKCYV